jgi:DNA adenine methylase
MLPFLRWAGSKRRLLGLLESAWGGTGRYIEPFVGSGALFFRIEPDQGIISDINADLIDTLCTLSSRPKQVFEAANGVLPGRDWYNAVRSLRPRQLGKIDRAARFIYLNRHCFNGLYRTNASGEFNVPYGPHRTGPLPSEEHLTAASRLLRRAKIVCGDFERVVRGSVRRGDFVYLDPPYAVRNRRMFRQYDASTFGLEDLERLRVLLREIDSRGAVFVLSYAFSKEAIDLSRRWKSVRVSVNRNIAGFASDRRRAIELLITNGQLPALARSQC